MRPSNARETESEETMEPDRYEELVKFARSIRGLTEEDARDIVHNVLLDVLVKRPNFRGFEKAYMKTAIFHAAMDLFRHRAVRESYAAAVSQEKPPPLSAETELVQRNETKRFGKRYHTAVAELPLALRLAFLLRLRGTSYEDIAVALNISMAAVKSRLNRAKKQLRDRLGEPPQGIDWPAAAEGISDDDEE